MSTNYKQNRHRQVLDSISIVSNTSSVLNRLAQEAKVATGKAFDQAADMKRDVKKKWLEKHLEEVEKLAGEWLGQLFLGPPFYPPRHEDDWKGAYQPTVERDGEKNHILRRHVRSRTLWAHYAKWQQLLPTFTALRKETLRGAKRLAEGKGEYWILTALWQAFELVKSPPKSEDDERDWELENQTVLPARFPSQHSGHVWGLRDCGEGRIGRSESATPGDDQDASLVFHKRLYNERACQEWLWRTLSTPTV